MTIDDERRLAAEIQIRDLQKEVDYDTKEYTVDLIVRNYAEGLEADENEIFIPDYQREYVWKDDRKSKFIESVILGLPIPYIFTATLRREIEEDLGRVEVVDGSQRLRTLHQFISNQLVLTDLEKLTEINGFRFMDFDLSRRRKILRRPIRVIELSEKADEEARRDIFERINTGSEDLRDMEKRKGIYGGEFYNFLLECANKPLFRTLTPISKTKEVREEHTELVLRFFAFSERYLDFDGEVAKFLNRYMESKRNGFNREEMALKFDRMINFVSNNFAYGFRKSRNSKAVPRMRFEAIACGVDLALETERPLNTLDIPRWLESNEFKSLTQDDGGNRPIRLRGRIEFVRDRLISP